MITTEIYPFYALLGLIIGALIERIIAYKKIYSEVKSWRSAGEVASKYKFKLMEAEGNIKILEETNEKLNQIGMEIACKLTDKENKIKELQETIKRNGERFESDYTSLLNSQQLKPIQKDSWGQKEYEHYKSKL